MEVVMIWAVLLLLVSVGLLIAGGVIESRCGWGSLWAIVFSLLGFAGLLWAFYLCGSVIFPFLFLENT
jgi:hypothetical protein